MSEISERQRMLLLMNTNGVTNGKAASLVARFGSASEVFDAGASELRKTGVLQDAEIDAITAKDAGRKISEIEERLDELKINYLVINEDGYPSLLKSADGAPLVLYYAGKPPDDSLPHVAVIGSRECTEYGINAAMTLSSELASRGVTIVSGMARGIDSAAHGGAISAGGLTYAVLGCGADVCYPPENRDLMEEIKKNGCVITEFRPGTKPASAFFPQRNRVISGLCYAVIVVEAGERSGTQITAGFALDQGRDVFAVPGSIFSKQSRGTNLMIKDYAYPVTGYEDILNYLSRTAEIDFGDINVSKRIKSSDKKSNATPARKSANAEPARKSTNAASAAKLDGDEKCVYEAVGVEPVTVDDIVRLSGLTVQKTLAALTKLEYAGLIKRLPGQRCVKNI